jgi:hypothetical protein
VWARRSAAPTSDKGRPDRHAEELCLAVIWGGILDGRF